MIFVILSVWCTFVFFAVPTGPNPYPKDGRWWLSYQLFGGRRGAVMLVGILAICFAYGLFMGRGR